MKQISVKITEELYQELTQWLEFNPGHNQSGVIATALEKYIHEPQILKPVGKIENNEFEESFKKMLHEHYYTMKKLS